MNKDKKLTDYYAVLGVPKNATSSGIQAAFRDLARKYHPDVNRDPGAEEIFKEMVEAYLVLKNPDKRDGLDAEIISSFCRTVSRSGKISAPVEKKYPTEFLRLLRSSKPKS
ncbi:MAG: DnaJ domain-containing protein [Magnetococcales bacterium]|nr:DnaJ domain-containing protein [Magnetococcales bacterium]